MSVLYLGSGNSYSRVEMGDFLSFLDSSEVKVDLFGRTTLEFGNISKKTEYIYKTAFSDISPRSKEELIIAKKIEKKLYDIRSEIEKQVKTKNIITGALFYISNFYKYFTRLFNEKGLVNAHHFQKNNFNNIFPWAKLSQPSFFNRYLEPYYKEPEEAGLMYRLSRVSPNSLLPYKQFILGSAFGSFLPSVYIAYKFGKK